MTLWIDSRHTILSKRSQREEDDFIPMKFKNRSNESMKIEIRILVTLEVRRSGYLLGRGFGGTFQNDINVLILI